ncbi:PilZ domain-containing protein [Desulfonema ishimotonii]|uniref:PilZ domain-containing protein n=1 Tax=Desulfonema ishimotonii TaxID=45657 RepID=A0A401FZY4_9BACT|nr:PilZ domain-containing protein [Desulfonema ishimotonii]GBC62531.1 PilZ domain-containing protein [Desulfonema ishimotonii]
MKKKSERRQAERFDLSLASSVSAEKSDGQQAFFELLTCNIGAGGAFFETRSPLPEGTDVHLDFTLPMDLPDDGEQHFRVMVSGTIIRNEKTGMAVRFNKSYKL